MVRAVSAAAATASYERAYEVSEHVGARMTQLRAAVRLARITPAESRILEIRESLTSFTEGFGTPDLTEAAI